MTQPDPCATAGQVSITVTDANGQCTRYDFPCVVDVKYDAQPAIVAPASDSFGAIPVVGGVDVHMVLRALLPTGGGQIFTATPIVTGGPVVTGGPAPTGTGAPAVEQPVSGIFPIPGEGVQ